MRKFSSLENLFKAALLAVPMTLMSIGRLVQGGMPLALYIPLTFCVLTFLCGAVTAWGHSAGMPGTGFGREGALRALGVVAVLVLVVLPVRLIWVDPVMRLALQNTRGGTLMRLAYPATLSGCLALMLWSAGFQTMFLYAAPMSVLARLTNSRAMAVAVCLIVRVYVTHQQIAAAGLTDSVALFVVSALTMTAAGCIVYCRYGLVATMVFAAGMDLHLFFGRDGLPGA